MSAYANLNGEFNPTVPSDMQTAVVPTHPAERNPECRSSTESDRPVGGILMPRETSMIPCSEENQILENLHFFPEEPFDDTP